LYVLAAPGSGCDVALALVGTGRDADHPLEVPAQVRLVGESGLGPAV